MKFCFSLSSFIFYTSPLSLFLLSLSPFVLYDQIINTKLCLLVESLHELQCCPSLSLSQSPLSPLIIIMIMICKEMSLTVCEKEVYNRTYSHIPCKSQIDGQWMIISILYIRRTSKINTRHHHPSIHPSDESGRRGLTTALNVSFNSSYLLCTDADGGTHRQTHLGLLVCWS